MLQKTASVIAGFVCLALGTALADDNGHMHMGSPPEKLGTVHFPISCNAMASFQFERGVALLHSFAYDEANKTFADAAGSDPSCAIAYWGQAMTHYHQMWEAPDARAMAEGLAAAESGRQLGAKSQRENDYIAAIDLFYKDYDRVDFHTRSLAYAQAMERMYVEYPDDREAAIFYALALVATAAPTDKTYANQKKAGAILEKIFVEQPDHPGVAHYIIHAFDSPMLAQRALPAARKYAQIAPSAPHALHMPSHIFTRLGLCGMSQSRRTSHLRQRLLSTRRISTGPAARNSFTRSIISSTPIFRPANTNARRRSWMTLRQLRKFTRRIWPGPTR